MNPEVFPYPFVLIIMHCIFCSILSLMLFLFSPSLFPALTDPDQRVSLTMRMYVRQILPISTFFAISLVLSNMAYKYSTVAFLQMIKESTIVTIYFMSIMVGIESFSIAQVSILVVMVLATWGCITGEMNFSLIGLLVQGGSSTCEAAKTICQSLVLAGPRRLDPLSTVLVVMPMSGVILAVVLLINNLLNAHFVAQPAFAEVWAARYLLSVNIGNAFALNWLVALFLKYMSPVVYVLTGNVKDISIVLISAFVMRDVVTPTQSLGFIVQMCCIITWTFVKMETIHMPPLELQRHHFSEGKCQ